MITWKYLLDFSDYLRVVTHEYGDDLIRFSASHQ